MSRKRYVYRPGHPRASANGFVDVEEINDYGVGPRALDAPIMMDRFYEGTSFTDDKGTHDLGSRAKHREYMKANGLTVVDDYKETFKKKAEERAQFYTEGSGFDRKARREDIGRALHEVQQRNRRK